MDEISQGPRRDFRLPSWRWLVAAGAAGLVAVIAAVLVAGSGGHHVRSPRVIAARGTVLLTCDSANWSPLWPNWQAGSMKAGPLWFVNGHQDGYLHYGRSVTRAGALPRHGMVSGNEMIIEVADSSTVTMTAAPSSRSYFQFFYGFHPGGGHPLPAGDVGFTFAPCPASAGPNGRVTDFNLGFSIVAGRAVLVEVSTPGARQPSWLTFTAPADTSVKNHE